MAQTIGSIGWHDLTVADAQGVRDFYAAVLGWRAQPLDMGGYDDYVMLHPGDDDAVAGICHARGANAIVPALWLIYFIVEDIDAAVAACEARGGAVVAPIRNSGGGRFCVIRDPAGAVCALYQP